MWHSAWPSWYFLELDLEFLQMSVSLPFCSQRYCRVFSAITLLWGVISHLLQRLSHSCKRYPERYPALLHLTIGHYSHQMTQRHNDGRILERLFHPACTCSERRGTALRLSPPLRLSHPLIHSPIPWSLE
jgi:hypothetical protein